MSGTIHITSDGLVSIIISNDKWCGTKKEEEKNIIVSKDPVCEFDITEIVPDTCFTRTNNGVEVTITDYSDSCSKNPKIPSILDGLPVKIIGYQAFYNNQLTSVTIPNGVTSIGMHAFSSNLLTNVTIPNSVINIEITAFYNNQLTSVTIPNSVTSIGFVAFQWNKLTSVTIPNNVSVIETYAFFGNQLTNLTIPSGVTNIGSMAFGFNRLINIILPSDVNITSSYEPVISDSFRYAYVEGNGQAGGIYTSLCQECVWARTVHVSASTPVECFNYTTTSTNVTITGYDGNCSQYVKIPEVIEGKPVQHIGYRAFKGSPMSAVYNNQLSKLLVYNDIPGKKLIASISSGLIDRIRYVELSNTIISIGEEAFFENELRGIVFPDSLEVIEKNAFINNSIYDFFVPEGVTINDNIFQEFNDEFLDSYNNYYNKEAGLYLNVDCGWINNNSSLPIPEILCK